MTQSIATLGTRHLEGTGRLLVLGDTVWLDGLCESRPGRGVLELLGAQEQLISTL